MGSPTATDANHWHSLIGVVADAPRGFCVSPPCNVSSACVGTSSVRPQGGTIVLDFFLHWPCAARLSSAVMYGLRMTNNTYTPKGDGRDSIVFLSHEFRGGRQGMPHHRTHVPSRRSGRFDSVFRVRPPRFSPQTTQLLGPRSQGWRQVVEFHSDSSDELVLD